MRAFRPRHFLLALFAYAALASSNTSSAQTIETQAREAILIDVTTGSVLMEKNADQRMPTASMSKIMTAYLIFDALAEGRLTLGSELPVSEYAWRMGGSKMFVEVNTRVRVEDLLRGVIVQSGNDASIVLAEGLAGSEEEFARLMTDRAHELGMLNSNFRNATGWPDPEHYSTARDLAVLASQMIEDFPQFYGYYTETEFTYGTDISTGDPITQRNRNPLLYRNVGADGLKTGHTEEAGYGLTASAVRDGRRLILVVNGLSSERERAEEAERLIEWGFREFESIPMFEAGEVVETADVWMGTPEEVSLVPSEDLVISLRRSAVEGLDVRVRIDEPVPAPISRGQIIATMVISAPDMPTRHVPLVAGEEVERKGFMGRVISGALHLALGLVR